jgi:GTPase
LKRKANRETEERRGYELLKPMISIVGRPNVGKSTLFNRLIGRRKAIIEDAPGVTRDRNYGEFEYNGQTFDLVDTGGFEPTTDDAIFRLVKEQIAISIAEASAIIFVLDGRDGMHPHDVTIADILRRQNKPVFYAVNKVDSGKMEAGAAEFYELGAETIYTISALHGTGIGELLDGIYEAAFGPPVRNRKSRAASRKSQPLSGDTGVALSGQPDSSEESSGNGAIRVAIVGRPNTGKSSITNRLLGSERMIVSDIPGTTRDSIDSRLIFGDREFVVIDTAGLRRKSRITMKVEEHSASSSIQSIDRADVVNMIIDAEEGLSHQDAGIVHTIVGHGKGLCIVVNKWDLVKGKMDMRTYREQVLEKVPHGSFAPVLFVSAVTGLNVERILEEDLKIYSQLEKRIPTPKLNKAFEGFLQRTSLPHVQGKQLKIFYVSQANSLPPTFVLFSNYPESIPEHYKRYLENSLRATFGFAGAPIRLAFKKK